MHVNFKMKYINDWIDHLGRRRYRFRRKGFPGVELPVNSDPASLEFQTAYHAALRGEKQEHALAMVAARGGSGTVANAIEQFLGSTTFNGDADSTKALRRPILTSVARLVGKLPLAKMEAGWVKRWLETASTMNVKRTRLLALKPFTKWAVACDLIETDPCEGIKVKVEATGGHETWTDEQIAQFRARHPIGSKARLALELLLGVALRRGDGISLGRQHVKDGWLVYTQEKNRKRKPVKVETPLPASLVAAIEACPSPPEALTFLVNEWGRPFSRKRFNTWFRKQVAAAGLPDSCVPHGLRKGGGRIIVESGGTAHEVMSVLGHSSLKEAERYTKAFNRKKLAASAMEKVAKAKTASNVVPLPLANR
jgi:site-specific recombinase XerD